MPYPRYLQSIECFFQIKLSTPSHSNYVVHITVLLPKFCTLHFSWTERPTTPITVTLFAATVVLPKSKYGSSDVGAVPSTPSIAVSSCQLVSVSTARTNAYHLNSISKGQLYFDANQKLTRINDSNKIKSIELDSCVHHWTRVNNNINTAFDRNFIRASHSDDISFGSTNVQRLASISRCHRVRINAFEITPPSKYRCYGNVTKLRPSPCQKVQFNESPSLVR